MCKVKFTKKIISALALAVLMLLCNINNVKAQNHVCKIGDTEYQTIAAAVTAASDGAEIQLITDAVIDNTITISKNITIDMAGYDITVSASGCAFTIETEVSFTINGGEGSEFVSTTPDDVSGFITMNADNGKSSITISNVSFHGPDGTDDGYAADNEDDGCAMFWDYAEAEDFDDYISKVDNLTLNNVNIVTDGTILYGMDGTAYVNLHITNGTYKATYGFSFDGTNETGYSVIDGMNFTSTRSSAIYTESKLDLKNSTITKAIPNGKSLVAVSGYWEQEDAVVTLTNNVVTNTGLDGGGDAVDVQDRGVAVIESGTYTAHGGRVLVGMTSGGTITVNGGTIDGSDASYALFTNTYSESGPDDPSKIIVNGSDFGVVIIGSADVSSDNATIELSGCHYQKTLRLHEQGTQWVRITGPITLDVAKDGQISYNNVYTDYTITADMTGATAAYYKIIDYTGSETKTIDDYNNVALSNAGDYSKKVSSDGDLYAAKPFEAGTLYVNAGWTGQSSLPEGLTWGVNAFATIQAAVNTADVSEGAVTISVAEGTYTGDVAMNGKSNLLYDNSTKIGRLHFIAEEGKTVTVNGQFTFGNDAVQQQTICDLEINGFTFTDVTYPLYLMNSVTASKDIVFKNNTISYTNPKKGSNYGSVYMYSASVDGATVTGNTFTSCGAIALFGQVQKDGVTISNNTFDNNSTAVYANDNKAANIGKVSFSGNTFVNNDNMVVIYFVNKTQKGDFVIDEDNLFKLSTDPAGYEGTEIVGWAETSAGKYLVNTSAASNKAVYYNTKLYWGNETAFTTIKAAYNAAPDNGILVLLNNTPAVEVAKSSIDMSTLGVNSAWSSLKDGEAVTVEGETFYGGLNAYSTIAAATAAVQTGQTVKLFSNIEETSVTTIPGGTFLNTNKHDLTATDITMGSNFTVNVTGLEELTTYWVMFYNASGNWAGNDKITTAAGQTSITIVKKDVSYASSRTYNADTWELSGTTTYATTFATIEVDEESTVSFTGFVKLENNKYVASSNTGVITVDMTGATENSYKLMDYTGSNDAKYGIKGSGYKFAEGKDNGYTLQVIDNDLVAYKSTTSKAAVAIKSDWAGTAFGTEVTLNGTNYTYGISGFSNFTDALGATDATTTSVVINGETFGKTGNTGTLYLTNTSGEVMNVSTVGAAKSSYPEACTGTYLSVGSGSEKQNYKFTEGSDLTVFQFYTGGSSNIDITVDGALKTEGSILLNGANVTVSKTGSISLDGSHRPSASGTIFDNGAVLTVNGALNLNINDVPNTPEPLRIKIGGDGADNDGIALIVDGGTATVQGVENTTGVEKFSKNPATTVIGGKVDDEGTAATLSVTNGGLYDTDGTIINNGLVSITIDDSDSRQSQIIAKSFSGTGTITVNLTDAKEASYLLIDVNEASQYGTVTFTGGTATYYAEVKDNDLYATKAVASITAGETTTYYATLADAIDKATDNDVITMLASTSENDTIPAEKTVTIDINGKVISALDEAKNVITNNGNLTLTDGIGGGNITGGTTGVKQNGTLTLSGKVNITGNGTGDNRCNLYLPSSDKTFSISNPAEGMKVGITKYGDPSQGDITLTGANTADYSRYFFSDNPSYSVKNTVKGTESNVLVLTNGVLVTLTATEGGEVELYVNGVSAGTSAYVTLNNTVTIKAKASDSNAFKGWYDTKNPTKMVKGKSTDTYTVTESVVLEARFTDQVIWVRVKKGN